MSSAGFSGVCTTWRQWEWIPASLPESPIATNVDPSKCGQQQQPDV